MLFAVPAGVDVGNLRVYGSSFSALIHIPPPQEEKNKEQSSLKATDIKCLPVFWWMTEE